jgi:DNA-binding transcriptional LysR family regulator
MCVGRIEDFQTFVAIVEKGSLTAAARQLGRSLQSVSRSMAALEKEVGVELVRRTTRQCMPSEAGQAFYRRLSAALGEIEAARREAANHKSEPSGLLRITSSTAFSPLYLVPAAAAFLERHPGVEIELDLSDAYANLVGERFDFAIRIGALPDSTLKARRLANLRRVVFAARRYLDEHGRPECPDDLLHHQCIVRTAARDGNAWPFVVDGRPKTIKVGGRFRASGALAANEAALLGMGLANAPLWQVRSLVDCGEVELVLTRFEPAPTPLHAVWPGTPTPPAKTQLFIDFLAARLKEQQL